MQQGLRRLNQWPLVIAGAAVLCAVSPALAHEAHHHAPVGPWWSMWNIRIEILAGLGVLAGLYYHGVQRLWRRAGRGRGISVRQSAVFGTGIAVLLVALVSPIDALGEQLHSMHMVQHMMLIMVAAPLLVLGSAGQALAWSLPGPFRSAGSRSYGLLRRFGVRRYVLWQPILMWTSFALVVWLLHIPQIFEAALRNRALHDLQHLAFVISACLFWRVLLDPISRLRLNPALSVLYLFSACLQCSAMGVFMAFSPAVWYEEYLATAPQWGVDPLIDQQIAGYVMWLPACFLYAVVASIIFGRWLQDPQGTFATGDDERAATAEREQS